MSGSIVSHRGYSISKTTTDPAIIEQHKAQLTIMPAAERPEYAHLIKPIKIYKETDQRLYMPRFYGLAEIGAADSDKLWSRQFAHNPNLTFTGALRSNQIPVVDVTFKSLTERGGGVISIECGGGKTSCSLYLACLLNKKNTVSSTPPVDNNSDEERELQSVELPPFKIGVVAHTTDMMKQWKERIEQFVPTARIGVVQQDKLQIQDKDIVIMSLKTVALRKYAKDAFEGLSLVIWDEIHLMCTNLFSQAFPKLASKYSMGLSATPFRKDKCERIFQSYIGPVVFLRKRGKDEKIEARCITYLMEDIEPTFDRRGKIMYTSTTVDVINREERSKWLADYVQQLATHGRTVLVLGEYVKHLKVLQKFVDAHKAERFHKEGALTLMSGKYSPDSPLSMLPRDVLRLIAGMARRPVTTGLYIGEMKNEQRKDSEEKDVILGTYKMASVGMDIPTLNCLVFASPRKDIEQSVGRILRKEHAVHKPLIIDVIDNHTLFKSQSTVRKKFYRSYGYTIVHQQVFMDGTVKSTRKASKKREGPAKAKARKIVNVAREETDSEGENGEECEAEAEQGCMFD